MEKTDHLAALANEWLTYLSDANVTQWNNPDCPDELQSNEQGARKEKLITN